MVPVGETLWRTVLAGSGLSRTASPFASPYKTSPILLASFKTAEILSRCLMSRAAPVLSENNKYAGCANARCFASRRDGKNASITHASLVCVKPGTAAFRRGGLKNSLRGAKPVPAQPRARFRRLRQNPATLILRCRKNSLNLTYVRLSPVVRGRAANMLTMSLKPGEHSRQG
jgi:hypothetical protein